MDDKTKFCWHNDADYTSAMPRGRICLKELSLLAADRGIGIDVPATGYWVPAEAARALKLLYASNTAVCLRTTVGR